MIVSRRRHAPAQPGGFWAQQTGGAPHWFIALSALLVVALGVVSVVGFSSQVEADPGRPGRATPTATASPTPTPSVQPRPDLETVRGLVNGSDPLVVSVLGDSTGNDGTEWVALWARHLSEQGSIVTVHNWDTIAGTYREPVVFGSGERQIEIWNGSVAGQSANGALAIVDALQPVAPNLLILNYGHNPGTTTVGAGSQTLANSTDTRWGITVPVVAMLQNPAVDAQAAISQRGRDSVATWAQNYSIPTVDVTAAFLANPNWASEYLLDAVHPNDAGSAVWLRALTDVLG